MNRCPACNAPEIEADTPRTVYACGTSSYDDRPGTWEGRHARQISNPADREAVETWEGRLHIAPEPPPVTFSEPDPRSPEERAAAESWVAKVRSSLEAPPIEPVLVMSPANAERFNRELRAVVAHPETFPGTIDPAALVTYTHTIGGLPGYPGISLTVDPAHGPGVTLYNLETGEAVTGLLDFPAHASQTPDPKDTIGGGNR
jgi:hypothetical protein